MVNLPLLGSLLLLLASMITMAKADKICLGIPILHDSLRGIFDNDIGCLVMEDCQASGDECLETDWILNFDQASCEAAGCDSWADPTSPSGTGRGRNNIIVAVFWTALVVPLVVLYYYDRLVVEERFHMYKSLLTYLPSHLPNLLSSVAPQNISGIKIVCGNNPSLSTA